MSSTQRTKKKKRRLELEALEVRQLLDGGGFLPALAPLTTFASASDFDQYFLAQSTVQYGNLFGTPYFPPPIVFPFSVTTADSNNGPAAGSLPSPQNPSVSEGNIVQSDGAHLYVAAQNQIVIMDTPPGGGLDVASRIDVPGNIVETFLDGTHLAVISQLNSGPVYFNPIRIGTLPEAVITVLSGPLMEVRVYDVSNARAPELNQDTVYDGTFEAASAVGDHLYVATNAFNGVLPRPQPVSNSDGTQSYESESAYAARVGPELQDLILPHFYVPGSSIPTLGALVNAPTDVYQGRFSQDDIVSSILTFDMTATSSGITDAQTLVSGDEAAVYTTADHLYFVSAHNGTDATHPFGSIIQRFDINGDHITPGPAGAVPAYIRGEFALDENNGYLRVATTIPSGDETTSSAIYVLQQNGTALNVVGALENIDPGVTYSAVRFNGNEVYLAADTELFGNPTELYVIDLTDPTNPALSGQIQSPGLESYLQVLGNGHLFAFGDNSGAQLSLFDVSNPANPAVVSQLQVPDLPGGFFPSSPVFSDPGAVTYSPGQNLLAIPLVGISRTSGAISYEDSLYQVDFQTGFHLVGAVSHDSPVERSLIQGDFFYTIAENSVKVQPIIQGPFVGNERMLSLGSSLEVRITDIPRLVTETPLPQINATQPFSGTLLNFTVTDPTGISVTITWGDGATSQGTITSTGNNTFSVNGQHTYAFGGPYVLTFSILRNGQDPGLGYSSELVQVGDTDLLTENFLERLYDKVLNRQTDQLGVEYWAAQMRQGLSRTFVAQAIMGSPEYQIDQINYLYGTLLGRQAENGAVPSWLAYLAGHSLDDMRIAFLSSQEFFAHAGSTANFVSGLFTDLLGRQASAADQTAWQTYLQFGLPRIAVVTLIARSQEAAVHEVMLDFQSFLGRPAELDGLLYFAGALQAGGSSASVEAAILGSAEFLQGS